MINCLLIIQLVQIKKILRKDINVIMIAASAVRKPHVPKKHERVSLNPSQGTAPVIKDQTPKAPYRGVGADELLVINSQPRELKFRSIPSRIEQPQNYLALAFIVTVCFNCPIGVIAILFSVSSVNSYTSGNIKGAKLRAKVSLVICMVAMALSAVLVVSLVIYTTMIKKQRSHN